MESEENKNIFNECESQSALNSLILDYYKKFGRKRDLEQFFSLSTAHSEIRDPTSLFWKKMKSQTDSDSGEKKSESSTELCRISIQCSIPGPSNESCNRIKSDSESPPIISEEGQCLPRNSDNESEKSDDIQSQKSVDNTLDTSLNKPHSPTSSITSQRKLEWDSLADVGYANESDRKNSASSLSTLERLALHQQYSNNDTKQNINIGPPTAQSTPLDMDDNKNKSRKGITKKTTKIYKKDVDLVEFNVCNENMPQPINVNLTKHISFNVEKDGGITVENVTKSLSVSPEKATNHSETFQVQNKIDKEIQTIFNKNEEKSSNPIERNIRKPYPVLISLNTLRKRKRKKKVRKIQKKQTKKRDNDKENVPLEKSGDQVSEAESFEYMPGHMYNLNHMKAHTNEEARNVNVKNNRSTGESSTGLTTDSSRATKCSFTKDLEKSIDILKSALNKGSDDETLKKKLVKEVVQRLIKSKYKDEESSTEFLSGLSFDSKKIDLCHSNQTTSTSDTNTARNIKQNKPKKSILRMDNFNSNAIASTSQSVPNLPTVTQNENPISYTKKLCDLSNTDSDLSNKTKNKSHTVIDKISSEELYKKYLEALQREKAYKKHLKDKELFLKQKLVSSDLAFNVSKEAEVKAQRVKDLMTDLVHNNYDAGSGDASRFEGYHSHANLEKYNSIRKQQTHSVFTLSSGNSDNNKRKMYSNKQNEAHTRACNKKSDEHYCCCPFHKSHAKIAVVDSSVQVNMTPKDRFTAEVIPNSSHNVNKQEIISNNSTECNVNQCKHQIASDCTTKDIKYVCLCADHTQEVPENILIYKCSRLTNKCLKTSDSKTVNSGSQQTSSDSTSTQQKSSFKNEDCEKKCLVIKDNPNQMSQSSQTNLNLPIRLQSRSSEQSVKSTSSEGICSTSSLDKKLDVLLVHEATRCVQTEISIDPKISDPSISDINIINDQNCVQLICEQYKKISRPNSESKVPGEYSESCRIQKLNLKNSSDESNKTDRDKAIYAYTAADSKDYIKTIEKEDKGVQMNPNEVTEQCSNNFTIPIQGTNMTLKVSLGSEASANHKTNVNIFENPVTHVSKATETVKNDVVENFTSLREECSKGIQSTETNIFDEFYQKRTTDQSEIDSQNICDGTNKVSYAVNTCASKDYKYNTYPKNDRNLVQKPLLRSNTDTDKIATHVTFNRNSPRQGEFQSHKTLISQKQSKGISIESNGRQRSSSEKSLKSAENSIKNKSSSDADELLAVKTSNSDTDNSKTLGKDPILEIIQDITRRYSKKDIEKSKRKKCFKEIITVLNYLLDTEDSTDDKNKESSSSTSEIEITEKDTNKSVPVKTLVDKGVQLSTKKSKSLKFGTESSDIPISTDMPSTSTDSGTCKILNKIKKECEKYHQRRCKLHSEGNICETSSSTSVNCHQCRRVHHCSCKSHKCKNHKKLFEKAKKKCVAYNLIIQTSDSVVSEQVNYGDNRPQLKNIIVKVPPKRKVQHMQFGEISSKIENNLPQYSPRSHNYGGRGFRNESEVSSTDDVIKKAQACTVREYLEKNRPDFVEKSSNRQQCLKVINETRVRDTDTPRLNMIVVHTPNPNAPNHCMEPCNMCYQGGPVNNCMCYDPIVHCLQNEVTRIANERATKRQLLSMQLDRQQALSALTPEELNRLARQLGNDLRRKKVAPKFISEREMKKHSEKIYKSLPEVVQKKEETKKENIKKTNLLMANIFKKNLQKKTLQGAVNLSNYSTVIKI